jgi:hypothetical protein
MPTGGSVVFSGAMLTQTTLTDHGLRLALACLLLGLYLLVYTPNINSADGEAILAVTASTLRHGVPDIGVIGASDALQPFDMSRMGTFGRDGAYYSKKGVTPSIALVPLVLLARLSPWLDVRATAVLFNPLVTMATALCLYTLARWLTYRPRTAFMLALIYGIATFAITYVKTLFGEPLAALLLLGGVMAAFRYRQNGNWRALVIAGFCAGWLAGVNLVYIAIMPVLGVYLFLPLFRQFNQEKIRVLVKHGLAYGLSVMAVLVLLGLYNWVRFGSPVHTGYHFESGEGFTKPLLDGIYGLTIGSYRGLFWYSPVLLLAIPGWLMLRRKNASLAWLILALTALQIVSFAAWWSWDGGIVWGPRFLLTVTPLIALCLAPLIEAAWQKRLIAVAVISFSLLSFVVQLLGSLYTIYPYFGYLFYRYYIPELPGLAPEVQTNPGLSAILGHLALAQNRWPLEPAWAANGVDGLHVAAALALIALGIYLVLYRSQQPGTSNTFRRTVILAGITIFISLNIVVARQGMSIEAADIALLEATLQPPGMVVAATRDFGESLVDLDNGSWVVSTNAPTTPDDALAAPIWEFATHRDGNVWLITWFAPDDPSNWQERDLWQRGSFAFERQVAGHRALLFSLLPAPIPERVAGDHFGSFTLENYGTQTNEAGLWVTVEWSVDASVPANYSWFIHVVDGAGNVVAQQDRAPQGGYAPTSGWIPGQNITDRLYFPDVKGDSLSLRIGWVDPITHELLATVDAGGNAVPDGFVLLPIEP